MYRPLTSTQCLRSLGRALGFCLVILLAAWAFVSYGQKPPTGPAGQRPNPEPSSSRLTWKDVKEGGALSAPLHPVQTADEPTPGNRLPPAGAASGNVTTSSHLDATSRYIATWESLDRRPLPSWYDDAKVGIFVHWGVYSVPGVHSEWLWSRWKRDKINETVEYMTKNYKPGTSYAELAPAFTAEFFDPDYWANLFEKSGARYVVLTSKHHDGYTLWPSSTSWNWNAVDVGPKRDLVGELAAAVRKKPGVRFGLYHSLYEWFNPLYEADKLSGWRTSDFIDRKVMPGLLEIVERYKPEVIWSDGDWEAPDWYWNSTKFLAWLYNDSPVKDTVVVNDRWGIGTSCKHGDFHDCRDRYNPRSLRSHKWENCMTIDLKSWGYRRNAMLADFYTIEGLLRELVTTVSSNGNILINVGPTKEGTITPIFEERLTQLGRWLRVNGEAVYGSRPCKCQKDSSSEDVWYTCKGDVVFVFVLKWPDENRLRIHRPDMIIGTNITMLGVPGVPFSLETGNGTVIVFPKLSISRLPTPWAWVLKVTNERSFAKGHE